MLDPAASGAILSHVDIVYVENKWRTDSLLLQATSK